MYDMIVIGCGSSSYSFLKGLETNINYKDKNVALICPSKYKNNLLPTDIKDVSPKFLQNENLLSLSYYLQTFKNIFSNNFVNIGVHGIGGMARIWGGSIGTFDKYSLERNGFNYSDFIEYYYQMKDFLPYCGNENDLLINDYSLPNSKSITISKKIKKLFGKYLSGNLKIGYPRLLIKDSCNDCNQCLIGCHNDSVWYPTENDFLSFKNFKLEIIKDSIVEKVDSSSVTILNNNNEFQELYTKEIILGAGVIQNYKLLVQHNKIKENKAKLYTTPAVSFAFVSLSFNDRKEFFGMGNATFMFKESNKVNFYGNLYDGYSLSLSKGLVFSNSFIIDKIYKMVSKYMIAGAGFMSSDNTDCSLDYQNNQVIITGEYSKDYQDNQKDITSKLKLFVKEINSILLHLKKSKIGADIHYAGGIPTSLYDKKMIVDGCLKGITNIKVIGGSTFSYLPPESPSLSFMANSYRIGRNL